MAPRLLYGCPVRLFGRNDTLLAAALIVATFILFRQPLQYMLEAAHDIELQYHLDLVQSLVVLGAVFVFHQYRKRHEARAGLIKATTEAAQARVRSEELERLVGLSRALAMATDFHGLHHAFSRYLPQFTRDRSCWLLLCWQGTWDVLMRGTDGPHSTDTLESIAERALEARRGNPDAEGIRVDGLVCFPMLVGGHPVGMMLVSDDHPLEPQDCRAIDVAAALAAISVRNVQTLLETQQHSLRDALTGCFNHAHALDTLNSELRRAQRSGAPLSIVMFDVDGFKGVNDAYGHLAGDRVLAEVGKRLGEIARKSDVKCRYGGDEFLLILPDTPAKGARQLAESIRNEVASIAIAAGTANIKVTASIGVVTATGDERSPNTFIARADDALYRAKRAGKNRVHMGDGDVISPLRLVAELG